MVKIFSSYAPSRHIYSPEDKGYTTLKRIIEDVRAGYKIKITHKGKDVTNALLKRQLISTIKNNTYSNEELLTLIERVLKDGGN